jgi:glycosyltransferase involved in cell wall biosynthesis
MKISLCLMVKNELEGCKIDIPRINQKLFNEVFAVDAGSVDGTVEFLKNNNIKVVIQKKSGYNNAYIEALNYFNSEAIVFFHPKGTINPKHLTTMCENIENGFDFVVGSRMLKFSRNEEDKSFFRPRKLFGKILGIASEIKWKRTFSKGKITDPLHGFRGFNRDYISNLRINNFGVTADLEMVRHAYVHAFKVKEFPVQEIHRNYGKTNFPALQTGFTLLKYLIRCK